MEYEEMQLTSLFYISSLNKNYSPTEVHEIHKTAHRKNADLFITGALVFGGNFFMQCLEGDREAVSSLFAKILADPRHERVILLRVNDISKRDFENWNMKLANLTEVKSKIILRHSKDNNFNPYEMSAEGAYHFLLEMCK